MKRMLSFLLSALLVCGVLTGCGQNNHADASAPPAASSQPDSGTSSTDFPETPEHSEPNEPTPPETPHTMPEWQVAYINVLNQLIREHGQSTFDATSYITTAGVKYANLLDFNGDGLRELLVVIDRTVQLYTAEGNQAKLLFEGSIGVRLGQTDVSYHFLLNSHSDPITLVLYHSTDEWNEEAITLVSLDSKGNVKQKELLARSSLRNDTPSLDNMNEFYIDGSSVSREAYTTVRDAATEEALVLEPDFGTYPITPYELTAMLQTLMKSDPAHYILPDSDCRVMSKEELSGLNTRQLRLARNEIYARYGRMFTAPDLEAYFSRQPWYQARFTPEQLDAAGPELFNKYELANLELIQSVENSGSAAPAQDLTEEEAEAIAVCYWDFAEGSLDETTGCLMAISCDGTITENGENFWVFRLRRMVDNNHWSTVECIRVNAQSGIVTNAAGE